MVGDKGESGCGDAIPGETAASLANEFEGTAKFNGVDRDDGKFATRSLAGFVTGEGDAGRRIEAVWHRSAFGDGVSRGSNGAVTEGA